MSIVTKNRTPLDEWGYKVLSRKLPTVHRTKFAKYNKPNTSLFKPKPHNKDKIKRSVNFTVRRVPEVVVKVTGKGHEKGHIKEHLTYISRNGKLTLIDQNGVEYKDKAGRDDILEQFIGSDDIPPKPEYYWSKGKKVQKPEMIRFVLSMPGHPEDILKAAQAMAEEEFKGRKYVLALHEDTDNPHVHLTVKSRDENNKHLNPKKDDLQRYRETFASKLYDLGIEANATPRWIRGKTVKADTQSVYHLKRKFEEGKIPMPKVVEGQLKAAQAPINDNNAPWLVAIREKNKTAYNLYHNLSKDPELSVAERKKVEEFKNTLPQPKTLGQLVRRDIIAKKILKQEQTQAQAKQSSPNNQRDKSVMPEHTQTNIKPNQERSQ
jgi:Relaxase/Mobilisation nuclease domain